MTDQPILELTPASTALVLVDLQNFTVAAPTVPLPGRAVLANAVRLADGCRAAGILVVLVRASAGEGGALLLTPAADVAMPSFHLTPEMMEFPPALEPKLGDVVVTKYNWGAFHCTDLDVQLRRRRIATLIIGGIATNYGVESTVRQAHERGFAQIIPSDATADFTEEGYAHPFRAIFPRIARIRTTDAVLAALHAGEAQ